jgi:heparanase
LQFGATVVALGAQQQPGIGSTMAVATLRRIATVDERYQSYNVEMAEVIGGKFWKPYDQRRAAAEPAPAAQPSTAATTQDAGLDPSLFQERPPIDLSNARLHKLAAALGPAYMRTSGTWANMVYVHDADTPPPSTAPQGFQGVLTRAEWKSVVDFTHAVNAKLVSSFTVSLGVRDASGRWTPDQARRFVAMTNALGGEVTAAAFFNEPNVPSYGGAPAGYTAADYARDLATFRTFAKTTASKMQVVGPGSVGEGSLIPAMQGTGMAAGLVSTESILSAGPKPLFDIFSYHFYGAASRRCAALGAGVQTTADAALSEEWLGRTERSFEYYARLRDRFEPGKPVWITETADSACGGNPWQPDFLTVFGISTSLDVSPNAASAWCFTTR